MAGNRTENHRLLEAFDRPFPGDGELIAERDLGLGEDAIAQPGTAPPRTEAVPEGVALRAITYRSEGLKVQGYLAIPQAGPAGEGSRLPCVIFNRGGNRDLGALSDEDAVRILAPIAAWGYVVAASQYRGNAGSEGREEYGGRDVHDVLSLIPLLDSLPQADARRIGMYGWSRGGMMTYLALARTRRVSAAIIGSGLADLFENAKRRPEVEQSIFAELIPNYPRDRAAALTARSVVCWPERLPKETPLLLLHGSADWRVPATEALTLAAKLCENRHPIRLVVFEEGDHDLSAHRAEVERLVRDWLARYVRDQPRAAKP